MFASIVHAECTLCIETASSVRVLITDTLPFLSVSHAGLQLHPGCHGDSAQHWSGYFVYPLFYLKTALLSESAHLCYDNYEFM